ncbi:hypothetical protein DOE51_02205 [Bdellovibrio sp. NC01]|nr:hypothetical protein DOE51_02205 [Bdellovibrio sp. NC01]
MWGTQFSSEALGFDDDVLSRVIFIRAPCARFKKVFSRKFPKNKKKKSKIWTRDLLNFCR